MENQDVEVDVRRRIWPQHLATLLATLSVFSGGAVMGWSAPAIPLLEGDGIDNSTTPITDEEGSWLGSISAIGALAGALPAGIIADIIGRKKTILIYTIPFIASWIMLIFVKTSFSLLCVARFISGLGLGAALAVSPLYCEEVSELRFRGITGTYSELMLCIGTLFVFVVGAYASYLWFQLSCCLFSVLLLVSFVWMPESPLFLLTKDRHAEADKALRWLRGAGSGKDPGIEEELRKMKIFIETERALRNSADRSGTLWQRLRNAIKNFSFNTPSMKAGIISIGVLVLQKLTASSVILYYTVTLFQEAGSSMSPYDASIIVGAVHLIAASITSVVVDRAGRKFLLIFSEVSAAITLAAMGAYFYVKESGEDMRSIAWLPVVILNLYMITVELGFDPVPWLVMAEVTPPETKGTITSLAGVLYWLFTFLVVKLYTNMEAAMGIAWTYFFYAICCAFGCIFLVIFVPETKGKTREEIQHELRYGSTIKIHQESHHV